MYVSKWPYYHGILLATFYSFLKPCFHNTQGFCSIYFKLGPLFLLGPFNLISGENVLTASFHHLQSNALLFLCSSSLALQVLRFYTFSCHHEFWHNHLSCSPSLSTIKLKQAGGDLPLVPILQHARETLLFFS